MSSLKSVLGREPDGHEIYRYRISDDRWREVGASLKATLRGKRLTDLSVEESALFCVFGAEWWRREHTHGPWSWHGIKRALGTDTATYDDVIACVKKGLKALGRPLLSTARGTEYLVTLACEGGLPLRRLDVEGANIQAYFRDVLEHFEATGITGDEDVGTLERIVRLRNARLPISLHHDVVYRLCGELLGKAWRLRRDLGTGEVEPIRALDARRPSWRDDLPLSLSDTTAEALLKGLLEDVAHVAAGQSTRLRFVTQIVLPGNGDQRPRLVRSLSAPQSVDDKTFGEMFGEVLDAQRVQVRIRHGHDDTLRAGILARAGVDGWAWQPAAGAVLTGVEGQLVLEALTRQGKLLTSHSLEGSGRLSPLPWVLRPTEGSTWELVGVGSTTRREPELLLAVPAEATLMGGSPEPEGELLGRRLVRVRGEVQITMATAGVVRVRTGQPENSLSAFELRGPLFQGLTTTREVWRGIPEAKARFGSVEVCGNLEVRAGAGWAPARGDEVGALDLRVVRDGDVAFHDRVTVAPRDLTIKLKEVGTEQGRPGVIEVSSARLDDAGVREGSAWSVERRGHARQFRFEVRPTERAPGRLPLRLAFGGTVLDGTVAFPFRSMRFETAGGDEITSGTAVHVKGLSGIRAVGLTPGPAQFHVTLRALVPHGGVGPPERTHPLVAEPTGEHALALGRLQAVLLAMLDAVEDLDAEVCVELWQAGGDPRRVKLLVRRYDWRLVPDKETGDVVLTEYVDADVDEDVIVEARPFSDIGVVEALPRLRSARFVDPRWVFAPGERTAGSWLITARQGGEYRCRPLAFLATGPAPPAATGLRALMELPGDADRMAAMKPHLATMASDWTHPDWPLVEAYARLLGDIPASTFNLFRALVTVPEACAALAMRAAGWAPTDLVSVIDGLDELAFMWITLPISAWSTAFAELHRVLDAVAPDLALAEVNARVTSLGRWLPTAPVAFYAWLVQRVAGGHAESLDPPQLVRMLLGEAPDRSKLTRLAYGKLVLRHHSDDRWPVSDVALPTVPASWSMVSEHEVIHRRGVAQAPVIAALVAAGRMPVDRRTAMFIETARAFDEEYFDRCFQLTFAAILASGQGVW
jgi:hypothetical protein